MTRVQRSHRCAGRSDIDANFSPALFTLACAHEALGNADAARQAYERTLRSLSRYAQAPRELVHAIDLTDIAVACHARLATSDDDPSLSTQAA